MEDERLPAADGSRQVGTAAGLFGLLLGALVLLVPVLIAPVPPITDYPNHLARMWLLGTDGAVASVAKFYRIQFDTFTNVGIDLIALVLGPVAGYAFAGRFAIALAVVLPALGGVLLWRSVHGRFHWWMLSFGLLVWGLNLLDGFLNFQIGIGAALLFAAAEPVVAARAPVTRVGIRTLLSVTLLLIHPFGLLFYAMLVVALIVGPRLPRTGQAWRHVLGRSALAGLSVAIVLVVLVLAAPSLPGAQEHSGLSTLFHEFRVGLSQFRAAPFQKLFDLLFTLRAYDDKLDLLTAAVFVVPVGWAILARCLRFHAGLAVLGAGLLAMYVLCPRYLLGAYWVDTRFAAMLPFTVAAAVVPALPVRSARWAAALLALAAIGRTSLIGAIWRERQADVASVAEVLAAVPAGAAILPVEQWPLDRKLAPAGRFNTLGEDSFRHLAALAIPWRHAFVPILFAARGKQPVAVVGPWSEIAEPNGSKLADVHALAVANTGTGDFGLDFAPYVSSWQTRFDYVLVVGADMPDRFGPFRPPTGLELIRDGGFAKLYKVH